ncbi:cytosolic carboxypeptidase 6-like isoform X1 [Rhopalosiphum padi]|uniref:cytosolic carboxypeptidase 6-like isoform X1 n=1 Tax=Rhopalosiphum padi TaxID=40932 RepID=UPI00298E79B0|nr:cytosolic carboxypeptidase 6-like isoform X1 [Rhopalosiphum padi]
MADYESDSDEGEAGLGNVTRVIMRPVGHSGKAKKGHLCFDASFETGNLGRIDLVCEYEYDLFIRPDTCNPRHRLWFNFVVENTRQDQNVIFNIVNISNKNNLFKNGMTPIVRSTSRNTWYRIPIYRVHYHRSLYHDNNYVLSILFSFDKDDDSYQFSYSYPYSYTRQQNYLSLIEKKKLPYFKRELLGQSIQNKRLDLITITNPKNMNPTEKVHVVVILGRVHGCETPSSYVCQGIIEFLISNHPAVVRLRKKVVFQLIPMMNPDGVTLGNSRTNLLGIDLNRAWHKISQWVHPILYAVHNHLMEIEKNENMELDLVIDMHAHSSLHGVFTYGNAYDDVYRYEKHILFPKLLSQHIEGYEQAHSICNRDFKKCGTSRRFLCQSLKEKVNCYTLFVSQYGFSVSPKTMIPFTEDSFYTIGRCVVLACSDYFKSTGVLTPQDVAVKCVKKRDRKRKTVLYRQRETHPSFKRKIKKKSLALKRVDIKDTFRSALAGCSGRPSDDPNRANANRRNMRFVDPSKTVDNRRSSNAVDRENVTAPHTFSIINVNDIIRDTGALLKF